VEAVDLNGNLLDSFELRARFPVRSFLRDARQTRENDEPVLGKVTLACSARRGIHDSVGIGIGLDIDGELSSVCGCVG
jgi:hypothetical protein